MKNSIGRAMYRAGMPAIGVFIAWVIRDLACRAEGEPVFSGVLSIAIIVAMIWLGASVLWWVGAKAIGSRLHKQ